MIPQGYVIEKFFMYCKRPTVKRSTGVYNAECPYCKEGKSAGRKRRFFYIPNDEYMYCQNCAKTRNPIQFVMDMSGMSYSDVLTEVNAYTTPVEDLLRQKDPEIKKIKRGSLPDDSINLFDAKQIQFFGSHKVVQDALAYIQRRHLDIAVNKPKALWISLVDFIHKNRLCFPFYDYGTKYDISYYQTRAIYPEDEKDGRKYISKLDGDKTVYNIQNISPDLETIFLFEGPINSMFVRNGVGIAGVYLTDLQEEILLKYFPLHKHVYVFDNQWIDKTSRERTAKLIQEGYNVFIWPKSLKQFKDTNEICVKTNITEMPVKYMMKHVYSGLKAELKLNEINRELQQLQDSFASSA